MRLFKRILFAVIIYLMPVAAVSAQEIPEDYFGDFDYDQIQKVIDESLVTEQRFDFKDYVNRIIKGEETISASGLFGDLKSSIANEFNANISTIAKLVSIAIIAAVFTNFSSIFKNSQVSETSFYITYLLMFTMLTSSFLTISQVAGRTLTMVLDFMKVLVPAFFLSVAFSTGARTSMVFYQSTLMVITLVDIILVKVIIPLINVYMIIHLANNLSKEDMLSKLGELIALIIKWSLKTILATVLGFNAIQGLIVPFADNVKKSFLMKAAGVLPGIGNAMESVAETVLGAGVLIKNAIGVAGLVVIIIICAIPVLKLMLYTIIYKIGVAVVQPISDKRILSCMNSTAESARLLLYTVFVGVVLFLLTITIIAASTSVKI